MTKRLKLTKRIAASVLAAAVVCTTVMCGRTVANAASGKAKITVKEQELILSKGQKAKLHVSVSSNGSKKLTFKSSDKKVAVVNKKGTVTARDAGAAVITVQTTGAKKVSAKVPVSVSAYTAADLVWEDNFDGNTLNAKYWNFEQHEPGWVNNELQSYPDEEENKTTGNVTVKDGMLTIQAKKTVDADGKVSYTSGRINTQGKVDMLYGRFETRAKVPEGKGFLPAFWMMPANENLYGQWPKCGEIDIMEVLGDTTNTAYGTLHFGEPHTQKQGSYELAKGDFSKEFHVFACEWDPDEIRFYVDGHLFYSINDWFSKKSGFGEITYPAPYDQPFYMILNLAVGGDWPGNPQPDAVFAENAQLVVDYVKVYQKKSYNENVKKPQVTLDLREPDAKGNYVVNGDFSKAESLTDGALWELILAGGGAADASISKKTLNIRTTNAGTLDYSVQIVQPNIPMEQGWQYQLSFNAYADEDRSMITAVTAPDNGYIRYLADTKVDLTTKKKSYKYTFDMTEASDANGRVEFNLGNQGSTAGVHISNVKVKKVKKIEISQPEKSVLPDGNYVYNGEFQEGADRLDYWSVEKSVKGASVKVTNKNNVRELKVSVPAEVKSTADLIVKQDKIALAGDKQYQLSFDARRTGAADNQLTVKLAGKQFTAELTDKMTNYKFDFRTDTGAKKAVLEFLLGTKGTTCIDNVRIVESGLVINGDFSAGLTGYEVYAYTPSNVTYGVDSLTEGNDNAFCMNITDTGDQDWHIQLKQTGVKLEKDQWYKISFRLKSDLNRNIMFALQRDGNKHDGDWTPYYEQRELALTKDWMTFTDVFQMTYDSDEETSMSFSMGAVGGKQISEKHTVTIDDIVLETAEPGEKKPSSGGGGGSYGGPGSTPAVSAEILKTPSVTWTAPDDSKAQTTMNDSGMGATVAIRDAGTKAGDVTLALTEYTVASADKYYFSGKVTSDIAKRITVRDTKTNASAVYDLSAGVETEVSLVVDGAGGASPASLRSAGLRAGASDTSRIVIEMGTHDGESAGLTPEITVRDCKITDCRLIKEEAPFTDGWNLELCEGGAGSVSYDSEKKTATVQTTAAGTQDYSVKFVKDGFTLKKGETYNIRFEITSSGARKLSWGLIDRNGWNWYTGADLELAKDVPQTVTMSYTSDQPDSSTIQFYLSLGTFGEGTPDAAKITISGLQLEWKPAGTSNGGTDNPEIPDEGDGVEMLQNKDFSAQTNGTADAWEAYVHTSDGAAANISYAENQAVFDISSVGTEDWHVQLKQELNFEAGHTYRVYLKASSTVERPVKVVLMNNATYSQIDDNWDQIQYQLTDTPAEITYTATCKEANAGAGVFQVSMGGFDNAQPSVITVSDVSVKDITAGGGDESGGDESGGDESGGDENGGDENGGNDTSEPAVNLLADNNWYTYQDANVSNTLQEGKIPAGGVVLTVSDAGSNPWDAALQTGGVRIEKGVTYKLTYTVCASTDWTVTAGCSNTDGSKTYGSESISATAESQTKELTFTMSEETDEAAVVKFFVGNPGSSAAIPDLPFTVTITDIRLEKVTS